MQSRAAPCPFCSHSGEMGLCCQRFLDHEEFWVQCGKCFARGPASRFPHTVSRREEVQELVVARWNRRIPDVRGAVDAEFFRRDRRIGA